jgi:NAD(P)H-hydrate epimerase
MPQTLISLTAPKPFVKFFKGRHFVGGRFLSAKVAEKYGIDVPGYKGDEQILEVEVPGGEKL